MIIKKIDFSDDFFNSNEFASLYNSFYSDNLKSYTELIKKNKKELHIWAVYCEDHSLIGCAIVFYIEPENYWFIKDIFFKDFENNHLSIKKIMSHIFHYNIKNKQIFNVCCLEMEKFNINYFDFFSIPLKYKKKSYYSVDLDDSLFKKIHGSYDDVLSFNLLNYSVSNCICFYVDYKDYNFYNTNDIVYSFPEKTKIKLFFNHYGILKKINHFLKNECFVESKFHYIGKIKNFKKIEEFLIF